MRKTVRDLIVASAPLTALIPTERWFQPGGVVDIPVRPFAVLRWIAPVAGATSGLWAYQLRVDVHDERGSYARIEQILGGQYKVGGVWPILNGIMDVTGADGRVTQADFLGDSGDQESDDYGTNYKFSSWQIIGRIF